MNRKIELFNLFIKHKNISGNICIKFIFFSGVARPFIL